MFGSNSAGPPYASCWHVRRGLQCFRPRWGCVLLAAQVSLGAVLAEDFTCKNVCDVALQSRSDGIASKTQQVELLSQFTDRTERTVLGNEVDSLQQSRKPLLNGGGSTMLNSRSVIDSLIVRDGTQAINVQNSCDDEGLLETQSSSDHVLDTRGTTVGEASDNSQRNQSSKMEFLDIRPRTIAFNGHATKLVPKSALPSCDDLSEYMMDLSQANELPRVDEGHFKLSLRDFCRATQFVHGPLYFENRKLEYQSAFSNRGSKFDAADAGLHFIWNAVALPLHVLQQPPCVPVPSGCISR